MGNCINASDRIWVKRIMVLVVQERRKPFEPNSCEFPKLWEGSGGCEARWLLNTPSIKQWAKTLKIFKVVEKERRSPQETSLRGLRICPLWTQRKRIWMRYGQQQRFIQCELREWNKLNTRELTLECYINMNSWIKLQTTDSYITRNLQSSIAWKMITHKKEITNNRRKQIHTTHCSI